MKTRFTPRKFVATGAALLGFYLLLVFKLQGEEIVAGVASAGLVAALLTAVQRRSDARFTVRGGWFGLLARRLPGQALADCGTLLRALAFARPAGAPVGEFRAIPFDADAGEPADEAAGRGALVIAGASLAPNSLVVALDGERDRLVVHQLVPTRTPPGNGDRLWPV